MGSILGSWSNTTNSSRKYIKNTCMTLKYMPIKLFFVAPWCSAHHYLTTSFNKAWTQILRRFKSCLRRVRDSRWWGSLTMVRAGNKAKRLSSVNHITETIHHLHRIFSHEIYEVGRSVLVSTVWWNILT